LFICRNKKEQCIYSLVIFNFSLTGSGDLWYSLKPRYEQRIFSIFNSAYLFVVVRALLAGAAANHATPTRADCPATGNPMMGRLPTVKTTRTAMVRTKEYRPSYNRGRVSTFLLLLAIANVNVCGEILLSRSRLAKI
jgi:hypothetical protein